MLQDPAPGLGRATWGISRTVERPAGQRGRRGAGDNRTTEVPLEAGSFEAALVRVGPGGDEVLTDWRTFSVSPLPVQGR